VNLPNQAEGSRRISLVMGSITYLETSVLSEPSIESLAINARSHDGDAVINMAYAHDTTRIFHHPFCLANPRIFHCRTIAGPQRTVCATAIAALKSGKTP
jgi:hypothetical protein